MLIKYIIVLFIDFRIIIITFLLEFKLLKPKKTKKSYKIIYELKEKNQKKFTKLTFFSETCICLKKE